MCMSGSDGSDKSGPPRKVQKLGGPEDDSSLELDDFSGAMETGYFEEPAAEDEALNQEPVEAGPEGQTSEEGKGEAAEGAQGENEQASQAPEGGGAAETGANEPGEDIAS